MARTCMVLRVCVALRSGISVPVGKQSCGRVVNNLGRQCNKVDELWVRD